MIDVPQEKIIIGELVEGYAEKKTIGRKLFALSHLSVLNKATLRHRNNRRTDFYWFPFCAESSVLSSNKWAVESVYCNDATIEHICGWTYGQDIRGPVIIKRSEHLMPCITIGARTPREDTLRETAKDMMIGLWHITESPFSEHRKFFADNTSDIVKGRMLFNSAL